MRLAGLLVIALAGAAHAGPTARFGVTFSPFADEAVPSDVHEIGPLVAIGDRLGAFVGELEWSYLSLFDPESSPGGVHRLGVTLRADLLRSVYASKCAGESAFEGECTHAKGLYVEGGAAERFGHWVVRPDEVVPKSSPQPELHLGVGFEMDNRVFPHRDGWQLGLRFAVSRPDAYEVSACRSTTGSCTMSTGGQLEKAFFVEWMFLIGH